MDYHERSMARARAEWRAKRAGKTSNSPWDFENWGDGRTQSITQADTSSVRRIP